MTEVDSAFDEFIASGAVPWIVRRTGASTGAVRQAGEAGAAVHFDVQAGAPRLPRLDATFSFETQPDPANATTWRIPELELGDDDPAFQFAVTQKAGEVTRHGQPVNQAMLTLTLWLVRGGDVMNHQAPAGVFRDVPDFQPAVTLSVPVTEADGTVLPRTVPGVMAHQPDDSYQVTFALPEGVVEAAYEHLTELGGASLDVTATYSGLQLVRSWEPDTGFPIQGPVFGGFQFAAIGDGEHSVPVPADDFRPYSFFPVTARFPAASHLESVSVGLSYQADAFRSRFTITTREGITRPIIDLNDLTDFAAARSEYRELTSLGDVQSRFPTIRRLYLGQVSGTVVALPAAYAIVHGAQGVAAACDALVDLSSNLTGSRFHFTFTLAPAVDPIDFAGLEAALPGLPEAAGRTLRLTLPDGLDPRNPSVLNGFPTATVAFGDGVAPHAVQVSADITDEPTTPALTGVNQFLAELCAAGPPPLSANLAVRLDDQFPEPVQAPGPLNLHGTAESDDLTVTVMPGSPPTATNHGPLDLVLHRAAALPQLTVTNLGDQVLAAGQTITLPAAAAADAAADCAAAAESVVVARSLAVPIPIPKNMVRTLVTFRTNTVQQVQHPLTVQAALDFTAEGVTSLEVAFQLTGIPGLAVPDLTLTAAHTVDFVHVLIPIGTAVTGLDTAVTLTITGPGVTRAVTVHNDFIDAPILTLTATTLTSATP